MAKFHEKSKVMKPIFRSLGISFLISGMLSSCLAYRNVESLNPRTPKELRSDIFDPESVNKLEEGDSIRVFIRGKKEQSVYFERLDEDQLIGVLSKVGSYKLFEPRPVEIPLSEIEKLKVKRKSPAYTWGVFVGLIGISMLPYYDGSLE